MALSNVNKKISLDVISGSLNDGFSGVDAERKVQLENLNIIRMVKSKMLEREQVRLTDKYGENAPKVQRINNKIEKNKNLMKGILIVSSHANIEVPVADETSWILHGFVRDNYFKIRCWGLQLHFTIAAEPG